MTFDIFISKQCIHKGQYGGTEGSFAASQLPGSILSIGYSFFVDFSCSSGSPISSHLPQTGQ